MTTFYINEIYDFKMITKLWILFFKILQIMCKKRNFLLQKIYLFINFFFFRVFLTAEVISTLGESVFLKKPIFNAGAPGFQPGPLQWWAPWQCPRSLLLSLLGWHIEDGKMPKHVSQTNPWSIDRPKSLAMTKFSNYLGVAKKQVF